MVQLMKLLTKLLLPFAVVASLVTMAPLPAPVVEAYAGDPVVTVVNVPEAAVGQQVVFDVTIDLAGFAPTNGSQRTQYRSRGGATLSDANYTVIPMTTAVVDGVTHWLFTYTVDRTGYIYFSVQVPVSAARIPRTVAGTGVVKGV